MTAPELDGPPSDERGGELTLRVGLDGPILSRTRVYVVPMADGTEECLFDWNDNLGAWGVSE